MAEIERAVLGAMLAFDGAVQVADRLTVEDFAYRPHRILFAAMLEFVGDAGIDQISMRQALDDRGELESVGGHEYIRELSQECTSTAYLDDHVEGLKDATRARAVYQSCHEAINSIGIGAKYAAVADSLDARLSEIRAQDVAGGDPGLVMAEALHTLSSPKPSGIVPTGQYEVDAIIQGMKPGELIMLAARPSIGKSSMGLNIARHAAMNGTAVGLFSLEMTRLQIGLNLISLHGKVNNELLKWGSYSGKDMSKINEIAAQIAELPIDIIEAIGMDTVGIVSKSKQMCRAGTGLIIVDYVQKLRGDDKAADIRGHMVQVSAGLKALAIEAGVPVLALSQVGRIAEGQRPKLSDLKESGSLEEDSDVVLLLHRDTRRARKAKLEIAKNRNGRTGEVDLAFHGEHFRFLSQYEASA